RQPGTDVLHAHHRPRRPHPRARSTDVHRPRLARLAPRLLQSPRRARWPRRPRVGALPMRSPSPTPSATPPSATPGPRTNTANAAIAPQSAIQTPSAVVPSSGAGSRTSVRREAAWTPAFAWIAASAVLFLLAAVVLPFVGATALDWDRVWRREEPDWSILTN